ncbi:uncharacterized protein LOC112495179 isoform X2 [Cephus cinctus]|uniref:Uncharacterized protein LOC112495179 isoform X2 n=1 Tax=Cephus cinctus TaxID=211228 RepID=A0AAJ7RSM2_CEPCN|nr:uncharacterized protein LOC112495179 isoform X2 [Cephus cinctus]
MTDTKMDYRANGRSNGYVGTYVTEGQNGFRTKLQINEWTFSLFLFVLSLGIVIGKLFVSYGGALHWPTNGQYTLPSLPTLSRVSHLSNVLNLPHSVEFDGKQLASASEKFFNASRRYEEAVSDAVIGISSRYGWLIRAALSGLAMMGFTWFIIYKDSSIPGVNPPSPFSPSKQRFLKI